MPSCACSPARRTAVSPTQFHNSVHNGPPAYWSIGAHSNGASTSLGCWDASFAAALLQAAAKASSRRQPVLLCAYDMPFPPPLAAVRATTQPFATAMVLTPRPEPFSVAEIAVRFATGRAHERASLPSLATLRPLYQTNPAARALRLLEAWRAGRRRCWRSTTLTSLSACRASPC